MIRRFGILGLLIAAALTLAACGDDKPDGESGSGGSGELEDLEVIDGSEAEVVVLDNTFDAENIQVAPGTRVVWTNNGRQNHDIVPIEGDDWGVDPDTFTPDAVYEYTFDQPGTYRYYCTLHGTKTAGMIGAVVVEE